MNGEIDVSVGTQRVKVFLQNGFFQTQCTPIVVHHHQYAEAHIFSAGQATMTVGTKSLCIAADEMLVIPAGVFHGVDSVQPGSCRSAFQVTLSVAAPMRLALPAGLAGVLTQEAGHMLHTQASATLAAYLSVFCTLIAGRAPERLEPIRDRAFIVDEFFAHRYHTDLTVGALAQQLGVSDKQAQRLVIRYMGRPFRDELAARRIEAAGQLLQLDATLSLTEVAALVGYRSYSGFWKAFRRVKHEKKPR